MSSNSRYGSMAMALLLIAGCAKAPQSQTTIAADAVAAGSALQSAKSADALSLPAGRHAFASLPDRGELLGYSAQAVRHDGAYTWHRANISEAHALHAMADGHLRLTAPSGALLDVQYDRHIEHPSGDWTWVGHLPGHPEQQTILTFGEHAAFGSIAQSDGLPLRLTVRNGVSWLVETDPRKVASIHNAATRPTRPDFKVPPKEAATSLSAPSAPSMRMSSATASATGAAKTTVDVVIGYTAAFAADNGGASGALTHLNFMVDVTNTAYTNSQIPATVRLVHAMQVSYPDATSNDSALEKLTGYDSTSNTQTTPDPAFNALRAAREQYGADLVTYVRKYNDPENGGCGIAWLIGGGRSGISSSDEFFGYSVVSDGTDTGSDGKTYFCRDETLAHELGHNMGAAHDVATSKGDDGVLDSDEYGAFTYSFGFKTTSSNGNFFTIMAYGDTGQTGFRIFSDPRSTFCGGRACGDATNADNARTLTETIPTIATFRDTVVPVAGRAISDFDADGRSDILWRNFSTGTNAIWRAANAATSQTVTTVPDLNWKVIGNGDFDGDGKADILWRNSASGANAIWRSGNSATPMAVTSVTNLAWDVAGVGDIDGDGRADIVWHNHTTGANTVWTSGNSTKALTVATASDVAWKIVAVGDFDGDGHDDLLWRNSSSGANVIWRSANAAASIGVTTVSDLSWKVEGAGDFNGDGRDDIVWRNQNTGADTIWRSGNSATSQAVSTVANPAWTIVGVGDYDGNGVADLLWRNTSNGTDAIWKAGNSGTSQPVQTVASQAWHVVP